MFEYTLFQAQFQRAYQGLVNDTLAYTLFQATYMNTNSYSDKPVSIRIIILLNLFFQTTYMNMNSHSDKFLNDIYKYEYDCMNIYLDKLCSYENYVI